MTLARLFRDKLTAYSQAEKSTIALYHHHPELRTVWGDLEADIPMRKLERAPQPPGFKATLLPFQQVRGASQAAVPILIFTLKLSGKCLLDAQARGWSLGRRHPRG